MTHAFPLGAEVEPHVSVIIPAVNESETLREVIGAVRAQSVAFEIIVVDGSSSDDTIASAVEGGARVISSPCRQRAYQLNLGARHARGEILLFLHADTFLPECAFQQIFESLKNLDVVGGAFARRYQSRSLLLQLTCYLARWRNRLIGWHLGDQAMFVRRSAFFQLGGFLEVDMFEDLHFSRRLKRFGRILTLVPGVISSSRRFARKGPLRTTVRDLALTVGYLLHGLPYETASGRVRPIGIPS